MPATVVEPAAELETAAATGVVAAAVPATAAATVVVAATESVAACSPVSEPAAETAPDYKLDVWRQKKIGKYHYLLTKGELNATNFSIRC